MAGPGDRERGTEDEKGLSSLAEGYRKGSPYIAASTSLVAAVAVFMGLGYWLDKRLGTSPWLFLVGAMFGLGAGFLQFYKTVAGGKK